MIVPGFLTVWEKIRKRYPGRLFLFMLKSGDVYANHWLMLCGCFFKENILLRIHKHLCYNEPENACQVPYCIPHQKFALSIIEQVFLV